MCSCNTAVSCRLLSVALLLLLLSIFGEEDFLVGAEDEANSPTDTAVVTSSRSEVLAALERNHVSLTGLSCSAEQGGPNINLGVQPNGGEWNNASDENLALVAQLPEVERLFLARGSFTQAGLRRLAALPKLRLLQIEASNKVGSKEFSSLPLLRSLETLSFGDYPVNDEIMEYITRHPGLRGLEIIKGDSISPAALNRFLSAVPDLKNFLLFGNAVDDTGIQLLATKTSLTRLIVDSRQISPEAWPAIRSLKQLRDLWLRGTSIDDRGLQAIKELTQLETLLLDRTRVTNAGLASLTGLSKLTDLGLSGTQISDAGMPALSQLEELSNFYVSQTKVTAAGLSVVARKERMVMLSAGSGPLSSAEFLELTEMFPGTQIFDSQGYWRPERAAQAREDVRAASGGE